MTSRFLATYDYGVKYITAACVEESSIGRFTLRLAANEGAKSWYNPLSQRSYLSSVSARTNVGV